jgi:pimeloyl-ACP methyl ester carboxylesterase
MAASAILSVQSVFSQSVYFFTKALYIPVGTRYGREALYKDSLAWQLYSGALQKPLNGVRWTADSLGRFIQRRPGKGGGGPGFGGGYLYLEYTAEKEGTALLHVQGDASLFFNGEPHAGDPYGSGWLYIPVRLKKGLNQLYIRPSGPVKADLVFTGKQVQLSTEDPTVPVITAGANGNAALKGAVVVINNAALPLKQGRVRAVLEGRTMETDIPEVPAMSSRKISFGLDASAVVAKGHFTCVLTLLQKNRPVDENKLTIDAAGPGEQYSVTFTSAIDGSLQYYAVTPQIKAAATQNVLQGADGAPPPGTVGTSPAVARASDQGPVDAAGPALFLSVHGAGVEAIGQARAYQSKDWGTLVAATNRRPRGFNWEDWGRLDAMEVLALAKARFHPDERYIYLTGHSMGGHGTWFLGATYPDQWAAIGACSGYPTLKDYGSHDGIIPDSAASPIEQVLLRASNQSDVIRLATNYKPLGVYILHGDSDKVVPVKYARQMRQVLGAFHPDMSYHEVPGAEHWYGNQSVDWKPLFDFFRWHSRQPDSLVSRIDFITSSPGISSSYYWAGIQQQLRSLEYSRIRLVRDLQQGGISGTTENIRLLRLSLTGFRAGTVVHISLDGSSTLEYMSRGLKDSVFLLHEQGRWSVTEAPGLSQKGPHRYGTFKDAFNHHMILVYGTSGSQQEQEWSYNKARYDAETWYYRGNGAVDIIADRDYTPEGYKGRSVILYGNATTNSAWPLLLKDCPIQVKRNELRAGDKVFQGDDLAAYFVRPLPDGVTSVAVITGTGLKGMEAANANQYFAGASGFPDYMIFRLEMLQTGAAGVLKAGFFSHDWKLTDDE